MKWVLESEYRPSDPFYTDHSSSDPSFHRPLPYRLLLKLHILCTFPCTFISKRKRKHVHTTHVDLNEGINLMTTLMKELMTQSRPAVKWVIHPPVYVLIYSTYLCTAIFNKKESNKRCSLLLLEISRCWAARQGAARGGVVHAGVGPGWYFPNKQTSRISLWLFCKLLFLTQ